jgi:hypothetical protein
MKRIFVALCLLSLSGCGGCDSHDSAKPVPPKAFTAPDFHAPLPGAKSGPLQYISTQVGGSCDRKTGDWSIALKMGPEVQVPFKIFPLYAGVTLESLSSKYNAALFLQVGSKVYGYRLLKGPEHNYTPHLAPGTPFAIESFKVTPQGNINVAIRKLDPTVTSLLHESPFQQPRFNYDALLRTLQTMPIMAPTPTQERIVQFLIDANHAEIAALYSNDLSAAQFFFDKEAFLALSNRVKDQQEKSEALQNKLENFSIAAVRFPTPDTIEADVCESWTGTYYDLTSQGVKRKVPLHQVPQTVTINRANVLAWRVEKILVLPFPAFCGQ